MNLANLTQKIKEKIKRHNRMSLFLLILLIIDFALFTFFTGKFPLSLLMPRFSEKTQMETITVYVPDSQLTHLMTQKRKIYPYQDPVHKLEGIFDILADRPISHIAKRTIPEGVVLRRAWLAEGIAVMDFDDSILTIPEITPTIENFFVYGLAQSIVYNMPEVSGVRFNVQGKPVDLIWGGVDLTAPISSSDVLEKN